MGEEDGRLGALEGNCYRVWGEIEMPWSKALTVGGEQNEHREMLKR